MALKRGEGRGRRPKPSGVDTRSIQGSPLVNNTVCWSKISVFFPTLGKVQGVVVTQKSLAPVEVFLGVPYATPPLGANRFSPTRSVPPWAGVRLCDRLAPVCPQPALNLNLTLGRGKLAALRKLAPFLQPNNEDCLYLNVYAPAPSTGTHYLLI